MNGWLSFYLYRFNIILRPKDVQYKNLRFNAIFYGTHDVYTIHIIDYNNNRSVSRVCTVRCSVYNSEY